MLTQTSVITITKTRIINGPSKLDLMLALFAKNDDKTSRTVQFLTEPGTNYEVTVNAVSIEDGSRESFLFTGYINQYSEAVHGWYDCRSRKGWINAGQHHLKA